MNNLNPLQMISRIYSDEFDEIDDLIDFKNDQNSKDLNLKVQNSNDLNSKDLNLKDLSSNDLNSDLSIIQNNTKLSNVQDDFKIDKFVGDKCSLCLLSNFKYKCPSCLVRTCSLDCFKKHKLILDCTGLKNSLRYKRLANFDDNQLKHDFKFLEDYNRQLDGIKRQKRNVVQSLNDLPNWLKKLKYEAFRRMIKLKILPAGFKRRLQNKTTYMYSTKEILWDIELVFVDLNLKSNKNKSTEDNQMKRITFHIQRVSENQKLNDLLSVYLKPANLIDNQQLNSLLKFYYNATEDEISILIKLSFDNYLELDQKMTINECLKNKTIIEYPTILVVLKKNLKNYNLIQETELKDRMQKYADKSYDLMIKNGLIKNKKFINNDEINKDATELINILKNDSKEELKDEILNAPADGIENNNLLEPNNEYFEESDSEDEDGPEEMKTKYIFDNSYNE